MSDTLVETTSKSWLSRIAGSIGGIIFGILLIIASIVLLTWNEGRAIQTARSLAEGGKMVIDVASDPIDQANSGKLIHVSGTASATAATADPEFGVSVVSLRLRRIAEMYQWEENKDEQTHKSLGGSEETTTIYTYKKVWSDRAINSQNFRQAGNHSNPPMKYDGLSVTAADATLGAFKLDAPVLDLLPTDTALRVDPGIADKIKPRIANAQVVDGKIYVAADPDTPQIGDYRISYSFAPNGPVSVIGRQARSGIASYQTKAGDRLLMAVSGSQDASEMFKDAERFNQILTWAIRAGGMLAMWLGAYLLIRPVVIIGDVVPVFGSILSAGAGLITLAFAIVAGAVVIAIAWLWYRPLVSAGVLAVGVVVGFLLHRLAASRRATRKSTAAA